MPCGAALAGLLLSLGAADTLRAQEIVLPLDPAVVRSLTRALQSANPELSARRAALQAAEANVGAVGWAPPLTLSGEMDDVPNGTNPGGAGVRIALEREFLTGGRREAARALAETDVRAAEAALYAAERRVLARSSSAILQIVDGATIARLLAAQDSLLQAAEESVRGRFSVGEARYVDVLRLRTERLRVQSDRATFLTQASVARAVLLGLLGADTEGVQVLLDSLALRDPTGVLIAELPPPPDVDSLLTVSGAIRLADAAVERAQAGRAVLLAGQRPRIAGSIGAQRMPGDLGGSSVGPTFGASVSLPFTARRANEAARFAADRQLAAAEAARTATRALVRTDLTAARERYDAARARLGLFEEALMRGAREERESALAAYRNGELSLIELIDFERALARAEIERLRARSEAAAALIELLYTTGDASEGLALDFGPESRGHDER